MDEARYEMRDMIGLIEQVLSSGGEFRFRPRGTSMLPLIRQGRDSVVLASAPPRLRRHDIPLYRRDSGQFVLHRVMSVNSDGSYNMCGDNQTAIERGIRHDQIIGTVTAVIREEKRIEVSSLRYRIYVGIWCAMPLRRCIFMARRIKSKIFKKI